MPIINKEDIHFALKPLPSDERDYSYTQNFGSISQDDLPNQDFMVSVPLEMKNQDINYYSDYCTGYGASEVAEDEKLIIFVPEWTFAQAKAIVALTDQSALTEYGLNLRDICNAAVQVGFLPRLYDIYNCNTQNRPPRSIIVDASKWPSQLLTIAAKYKMAGYYTVDGPHDTFNNFRSVLWNNLKERRSILTGCIWRESWNTAANGIIPKVYEDTGSAHAFKIFGQKTINGEVYLIMQGSDGVNAGDNGLFYFSRDTVNKEFGKFGAFTFKDPNFIPAQSPTNGVYFNNIWSSLCPLWVYKIIRKIFNKNP
jgi:hypothetical protein